MPILAALWPALILAMYLPTAQNKLETDISSYKDANNTMLDILTFEPERTELGDPNNETVEFSYDNVIVEVASLCNISSDKCKWNTGKVLDTKASKTQSANVTLSGVDITSFAKFLSVIQSRWPKLVCNSVKLTKKENSPDEWDVHLDFKYFYTASD